jgi:hypothetical protein
MPASYDLVIYRGDTYSWDFLLWNDIHNGIPTDLTGVVVKSEIRDRPSGNLIIPLTLTVTLPNTINAALSAASSALLPVPLGVWDLQLTYPDGDVLTVIAGEVYVTADVTGSAGDINSTSSVRLVA